jgi:hypothetical protein
MTCIFFINVDLISPFGKCFAFFIICRYDVFTYTLRIIEMATKSKQKQKTASFVTWFFYMVYGGVHGMTSFGALGVIVLFILTFTWLFAAIGIATGSPTAASGYGFVFLRLLNYPYYIVLFGKIQKFDDGS